ncbi:MAG: DUF3426 domain-containing protein [Rhodocyclaceae bacterium]
MLIVRCPACQTVFRLRPEQLRMHGGMVRCGHCYTPFNAREHFLDGVSAPHEAGPAASAGVRPSAPPASSLPDWLTAPRPGASPGAPAGHTPAPKDEPDFFVLEEAALDPDPYSASLDFSVPDEPHGHPRSGAAAAHASGSRPTHDVAPPHRPTTMDAYADRLESGQPERSVPPPQADAPPSFAAAVNRAPTPREADARRPDVPHSAPPTSVRSTPTHSWPALEPSEHTGDDTITSRNRDGQWRREPSTAAVPARETPTAGATPTVTPPMAVSSAPEPEPAQAVRSPFAPPKTAQTPLSTASAAGSDDPDRFAPAERLRDEELRQAERRKRREARLAGRVEPREHDEAAADAEQEHDAYRPVSAPPSAGARWTQGLLVGLLLGLLLAQGAYVFRDDITRNWPELRPLYLQACAQLGCDLPLPRVPQLIGIETSDLQSEPAQPNHFVLNALIRNRASHPQAYPHLELTLTDARDRPVIRRVLTPEEWVADPAELEQGFAADFARPLRLSFETNGVSGAMGYRVYAFYP